MAKTFSSIWVILAVYMLLVLWPDIDPNLLYEEQPQYQYGPLLWANAIISVAVALYNFGIIGNKQTKDNE